MQLIDAEESAELISRALHIAVFEDSGENERVVIESMCI